MKKKSNLTEDKQYNQLAINLSLEAYRKGNAPFGAAIVKNDIVLASTPNQTIAENNLTMHAEMVCIREASKKYGIDGLAGATMYCSCEPCIMCLFGAYYARIKKIVYSAELEDAIKYGSGDPPISSKWIIKKANLGIEFIQSDMKEDALKVFEKYFSKYGPMEKHNTQ